MEVLITVTGVFAAVLTIIGTIYRFMSKPAVTSEEKTSKLRRNDELLNEKMAYITREIPNQIAHNGTRDLLYIRSFEGEDILSTLNEYTEYLKRKRSMEVGGGEWLADAEMAESYKELSLALHLHSSPLTSQELIRMNNLFLKNGTKKRTSNTSTRYLSFLKILPHQFRRKFSREMADFLKDGMVDKKENGESTRIYVISETRALAFLVLKKQLFRFRLVRKLFLSKRPRLPDD